MKKPIKELVTIGTEMFHPCSLDIIKHKVTGIRQYEDHTIYELKSVHAVGACGIIRVLVSLHKDKLTFVELLYEEDLPHASGLGDFVEGTYYLTLDEAKLDFYRRVEGRYYSNIVGLENSLKKAIAEHERIKALVKLARKSILKDGGENKDENENERNEQ
jgi:hypothetical protein